MDHFSKSYFHKEDNFHDLASKESLSEYDTTQWYKTNILTQMT